MADEKKTEDHGDDELPKRQKKSSKILVLLVAVVALTLITGVVVLLLRPNIKNTRRLNQANPATFGVAPVLSVFPLIKDKPLSFTVNLKDEAERHILLMDFRIGYISPKGGRAALKTLAQLSDRKFQIYDTVTKILMDKKSEDFRGRDKINSLEQEITDAIKNLCEPKYRKYIKQILIQKLLIQ